MNPLFASIKTFKFPERAASLLLLALCTLAFGLLIPRLGFYWDDWPTVFMGKMEDARGLFEFFSYDRPSSAWFYAALLPVLRTSPLPWHIYILLVRWLTTVLVWLTMRALWPDRRREALSIALIFAVYPSFTQDAIAVTYSIVWTQYALYLLSWYWMILAARGAQRKRALAVAALIALALSHSLSEYFFGLELLRPFILWKVLSDGLPAGSPEQRRTFSLAWAPFVILDAAYLFWRTFVIRFFLAPGAVRLNPKLLHLLVTSPLAGAWRLVQLAVPDILQALAGTWAEIMQPARFDFGKSIAFVGAAAGLLAGALTIYFLTRVRFSVPEPAAPDSAFVRQALLFGLAAIVLGSAPAWAIERQATIGRYSDRFALVAMLGASIALVGIIGWFSQRATVKTLTIGLLVMLAVNQHVIVANQYRHAWEREQLFYWQLYWRLPGLAPGTALIADSEVIPYSSVYSSSLGVNLIYSRYEQRPNLDYWILTADNDLQGHLAAYRAGRRLRLSFRAWNFSAKSSQTLAISNSANQCLHVLGPGAVDSAGAPAVLQPYLPRSDLARVVLDESQRSPMPTDIFGNEPEHGWCYYYEKAALAAQQGKWQAAADLGRQAERAGLKPADPWEWLVFIEAGIRSGDPGRARDLTVTAGHEQAGLAGPLCGLWNALSGQGASSAEFQESLGEVRTSLNCAP
jgi:hypothetical protein